MREIKFRVWNGVEMLSLSQAQAQDQAIIQHDHKESYEIEPGFPETVIMQFTGLVLKDGTEVYEGDIFSRSFLHNYPTKTSTVVWHNMAWHLKVCSEYRPMADGLGWVSIHSQVYGDIEVIGNIYEQTTRT